MASIDLNASPAVFLQNDGTFLVIVCAIAFIFSTFIHKFNRTRTRKAPLVKYMMPWIGSAVQLGKNPDALFKKAAATHGSVFRMYTGGREFTYITVPDLISIVYRNPKIFKFLPIKLEITEKMLGASKSLCKDPVYYEDFFKLHHKLLTSTNSSGLLERYGPYAYECLQKVMSASFDDKIGKVTGLSFIKSPAYNAAAYAVFGETFPASETFGPFLEFFEGSLLLQTNLPHFLKRKVINAREMLLKMIEDYLSKPHEDCSSLRNISEEHFDRTNWSLRDKAASTLGDLWALQSNAVQAVYWIIALQLQRPEGLGPLVEEIDSTRNDWLKTNNNVEDTTHCQWILDSPLPLLTSVIHECLRYTTYSFSIRQANEETVLGGYNIAKGDFLICSTRAIHMDNDIHENPTEFIPDRYIKATKFKKDGRVVPNHSMPFGGGVSMCEGRHFALGELKIFTALLLSLVDIELDSSSSERPQFNWPLLGTGVVPPTGDLSVRVTRRRG